MAAARDVAQYLIRIAVTGDEPDPLSHLRLQKLLYYVQAWHLAAFGTPMFRERIEAWRDGPVVTDVWPHYEKFGFASILPAGDDASANLSREDQAFIKSIWDRYKCYSATQLSKMTHNEQPWQKTRGDLPAKESSSEEITHESMRAYYSRLLAARMPKGISLFQLIKADEDMDRGKFRTHHEVKARIGKGDGL